MYITEITFFHGSECKTLLRTVCYLNIAESYTEAIDLIIEKKAKRLNDFLIYTMAIRYIDVCILYNSFIYELGYCSPTSVPYFAMKLFKMSNIFENIGLFIGS